MSKLKLMIFIFSLIVIGGRALAADTPSAEELYIDANRAYKEENYQKAITSYRKLISEGYVTGHLYYNLGNSYFRSGNLGQAILNYKRAQLLMPRDADLKFNLSYALDKTPDVIDSDQSIFGQAFFWLQDLTFRELMWGFAVLNIVFWGILVLRLFVRPEWSYYVFMVILIFWLLAGVSLGAKWQLLRTDRRAVILDKEIEVLAGPESNDTVLFKLHEGTTVEQERTEGDWSLIRVSENKRGWIQSSAIEMIISQHSREY